MTREQLRLKGPQQNENEEKWFPKSESNFPFYLPFHTLFPPILTFSLFLIPPAELLSACHELRCRYGCVMTRNGTFCFCADGFEVGEDGTSCRGRIQLWWWGLSAMEPRSLFALGQTSFRWISRRSCVYENHLSAGRPSCTVQYIPNTHPYTHILYIQNTISLTLLFYAHRMCHRPGLWQPVRRQDFAVKGASSVLLGLCTYLIPTRLHTIA